MNASRLFPHGHETHVPPASARAFVARSGDYVTVVDVEGQQIGDFVALNAADHNERFSTCHTRSELRRIYVRKAIVCIAIGGDHCWKSLRTVWPATTF